jgi:hypothetical protein
MTNILAHRRIIDGPEARVHIADMIEAGTTKSAQQAMARLALKYALLTDSARAAWQEVLS